MVEMSTPVSKSRQARWISRDLEVLEAEPWAEIYPWERRAWSDHATFMRPVTMALAERAAAAAKLSCPCRRTTGPLVYALLIDDIADAWRSAVHALKRHVAPDRVEDEYAVSAEKAMEARKRYGVRLALSLYPVLLDFADRVAEGRAPTRRVSFAHLPERAGTDGIGHIQRRRSGTRITCLCGREHEVSDSLAEDVLRRHASRRGTRLLLGRDL